MNSMIQTIDLTKKFGDFTANDHINLDVKEQEIKCIVGENGAGKSTMMNMLYGLLQPTSGKILIRGKEVTMNSPIDAIANGIGMVHQHFKLVPSLTVYENILLGAEIKKKNTPFVDQKEEIRRIEKLIEENHFELNATDKIEDISVGGRQRVEILKMLYRNVDILILDEPTAVLTPQEVDELMVTLKQLKEQGKTIIVITHKLREVMELADSITVIKQGKVIGNVLKKDTNEQELAQMMVGRDVVLTVSNTRKQTIKTDIMYEAKHLTTVNDYGKEVVSDVSFKVHKGEILGVCGLSDAGIHELGSAIYGLEHHDGTVRVKASDTLLKHPDDLVKTKGAYLSKDRDVNGLMLDAGIGANLIIPSLVELSGPVGFLSPKKTRALAEKASQAFEIKSSGLNHIVRRLSGGNKQKVNLSRWLVKDLDYIILDCPTRGVDIGVKAYIYSVLKKAKAEGKAIIMISDELQEAMGMSDRIMVMKDHKFAAMLSRNCDFTEEKMMEVML